MMIFNTLLVFVVSLTGFPAGLIVGRFCLFEKDEITPFITHAARFTFLTFFLSLFFFLINNTLTELVFAIMTFLLAFFIDYSYKTLIAAVSISTLSTFLVIFVNVISASQAFFICVAIFSFLFLASSLLVLKFIALRNKKLFF
ncbi:MAG: hypothetical protein QW471_03080 [Candidatus Woesearchaeota archaeon]